jgi:acyl carrier protein
MVEDRERMCQFLEILSNVLEVNVVKLDDDFFSLGGDSLSAVELSEALEKSMEIRLPLNVLFGGGDIRELWIACSGSPLSSGE